MYLEFHGLRDFPFAIGCHERLFYESAAHGEALANMVYTIQQRKGMVLITGEVGAGKTFMGVMVAERLGSGCLTLSLAHPPDSAKQLLRAVAEGLDLRVRPEADRMQLATQIEKQLARLHRRKRLVALIIDEAQELNENCLKQVRLLWNFERQGDRLVQIVLLGQPELREMIQEPQWEPLQQRIVLSYHLGSLSYRDTVRYIMHRIRLCADRNCRLGFTLHAAQDVYAATKGIPRLINVLCDNALLVGYVHGTHRINRRIIAEVVKTMTCWPVRPQLGLRPGSSPEDRMATAEDTGDMEALDPALRPPPDGP